MEFRQTVEVNSNVFQFAKRVESTCVVDCMRPRDQHAFIPSASVVGVIRTRQPPQPSPLLTTVPLICSPASASRHNLIDETNNERDGGCGDGNNGQIIATMVTDDRYL